MTDYSSIKSAAWRSEVRGKLESALVYYEKNSWRYFADEDALCTMFLEAISVQGKLENEHLRIISYKLKGRGRNAPEKLTGADGIGLISICTDQERLDGYFLFQAKKATNGSTRLQRAKKQCSVMLDNCSASYLLVLMPDSVRMIGAMAVVASSVATPILGKLPHLSFARTVESHFLRGLMLESLSSLMSRIGDLSGELRYAVQIIIGRLQEVGEAQQRLNSLLADINPEAERLSR